MTPPRVEHVAVVDRRRVTVTLVGTDPVPARVTAAGRTPSFIPDRLTLEWTTGLLYTAILSGRRVADGQVVDLDLIDRRDRNYLNAENGRTVYVARFGLDLSAPRWVADLVMEHQP